MIGSLPAVCARAASGHAIAPPVNEMKSRRRIASPRGSGKASYQVELAMSALGQKQTFAVHQPMSALPPIADSCSALAHVRFGPKADIGAVMFTFALTPRSDVRQGSQGAPALMFNNAISRLPPK